MNDLITYSLPFILGTWAWVSYRLFNIHQKGVEVFFTMKYKSYQVQSIKESRRHFFLYLVALWVAEVVMAFILLVNAAILVLGV